MNMKPDIVSLKWVIGLINEQADAAEAALVEYGQDPAQKQALLRCMWSVHQITSTLRALGMRKAEMLTLEMERSLNFLYKDKVLGERRKLAMGGLMQALKIIPAYLEHTQNQRVDTGRGLEKFVNDLRRWVGERPRPTAFFFYMEIDPRAGITAGAMPAADEEIRSRANVMLALYLEMAKQALRKRNVTESMKTVARIARKMQILMAGSEQERFWFTMIGLCEGIAGGLIVPDECIAQIFKSGAFAIKFARENGSAIDDSIDYDSYLQQMLYYVASCRSRPVHITAIRQAFGITDNTIMDASQGLVHSDAIVIALKGALHHLNTAVEYLSVHDLVAVARKKQEEKDISVLDAVEAAEQRLVAAGQLLHADSLRKVQQQLRPFFSGGGVADLQKVAESVREITVGISDVKTDIEHKLQHGLNSSYAGKEFELRESVATATFRQMGLVENYLHQILRRKALKSALDKKPFDRDSVLRLTTALQRHLNKTDKGDEELRQAIRDADNGDPDLDLLYSLSLDYLGKLESIPDRRAISESLQLLDEIAGALHFSGMAREGAVIEQCAKWLSAASDAGSVREDDAFRCFADAFAQIEMHLQRSILDPLDDTSHILALAEQRAAELGRGIARLSPGRKIAEIVATTGAGEVRDELLVQDVEIPEEFRDVFIEESEEMVAELSRLTADWLRDPNNREVLRDIRRHFHTFKGNGRAVGANVLGELGWAAQDMLDRSLDGELAAGATMQSLVNEVVSALPDLVRSYSNETGPDIGRIRELTNACFSVAASGEPQAQGTSTGITGVINATGGLAESQAAPTNLTH
ncbi:MAG: Hpt domain-containing protein [Halioglobus sp.]|nr:Hpt domain-containing protein [Halioglobus sp.]